MALDGFAPGSLHQDLAGTHVHPTAMDDGMLCRTIDFDYGEAPSENLIPMSTVCSAFSTIFDWICMSENVNMAAARAHTLLTWLNPVDARYKSLNQIALKCAVSRSALSKALLNLRDQYSIRFTIGRLESAREIFRQAQLDAVKNGTHASRLTRKNCSMRNAMSP